MNGTAATTYYTLEEISKNDAKNGNKVWIIIKNVVYDVTSYIEEHPGGADLVTEYAGKDATKAFDDFGHSGDAKKQLKQYRIGEVDEKDRGVKTQQPKMNGMNGRQAKSLTSPDVQYRRSCISIITCGLLG